MAILVFGLVSESKPGFIRAKLPTYDGIVTDWLPIVKMRATGPDDENYPMETDEQVALVVDEHCKTGVCLGAISSDADPAEASAEAGKWRKVFKDGQYLQVDTQTGKTTINSKNAVVIKSTSESLYQVLSDLLTAIKLITVNTGTGTSTPPNNVAAFNSIATRLSALLSN